MKKLLIIALLFIVTGIAVTTFPSCASNGNIPPEVDSSSIIHLSDVDDSMKTIVPSVIPITQYTFCDDNACYIALSYKMNNTDHSVTFVTPDGIVITLQKGWTIDSVGIVDHSKIPGGTKRYDCSNHNN